MRNPKVSHPFFYPFSLLHPQHTVFFLIMSSWWQDGRPYPSISSLFQSRRKGRDFPGGPVVKNPPSNSGDMDSIPGQGTKIPHARGQLSPCATTTELTCLNKRSCVPQTTEPTHSGTCEPQLQSPPALEPACHN